MTLLQNAFDAFDAYNAQDPNHDSEEGKEVAKELLYARRMTARLNAFAPNAPEYLQLAARCQHIGRWEIARSSYPMDRKGYLQWRNQLKIHHAGIARNILSTVGYSADIIDQVEFLLLKKELHHNLDTQLLEDVICLVFIEYYLEEFASKHEPEKVIDILRKTMKKMSTLAITKTGEIPMTASIKELIAQAATITS